MSTGHVVKSVYICTMTIILTHLFFLKAKTLEHSVSGILTVHPIYMCNVKQSVGFFSYKFVRRGCISKYLLSPYIFCKCNIFVLFVCVQKRRKKKKNIHVHQQQQGPSMVNTTLILVITIWSLVECLISRWTLSTSQWQLTDTRHNNHQTHMNTIHTDTGLPQDITSIGQQCGQGPGPFLSSGQQDGPTALQRGLRGHLDGADDTRVAGQGHHPLLQAVHQPRALAQSQTLHVLRLRDGCVKLQEKKEEKKLNCCHSCEIHGLNKNVCCLYVCVSVYHYQVVCMSVCLFIIINSNAFDIALMFILH